jgi:hypothetical protein
VVSLAAIRLGSWESGRAFKGIICDDISEFESHMPSHAVSLCGLCSRDASFVGSGYILLTSPTIFSATLPPELQGSQAENSRPQGRRRGGAIRVGAWVPAMIEWSVRRWCAERSRDYEECIGAKKHLVLGLSSLSHCPVKGSNTYRIG